MGFIELDNEEIMVQIVNLCFLALFELLTKNVHVSLTSFCILLLMKQDL